VQDADETKFAAQTMPWVRGDGLERRGDGVEQDGVEQSLVLKSDRGDPAGHPLMNETDLAHKTPDSPASGKPRTLQSRVKRAAYCAM